MGREAQGHMLNAEIHRQVAQYVQRILTAHSSAVLPTNAFYCHQSSHQIVHSPTSNGAKRWEGLCTVDQSKRLDGNRRALSGPIGVVQVVKVAAQTLVKDVGAAKGK